MRKIILTVIAFLSIASFAVADEQYLEDYFNQLSTLEADFAQTVIQQKSKEESSGILKIRRKSASNPISGFYFDYTSPFVQKIISNGDKLWHYDMDLEQIVIKSLADYEKDSPIFMVFNQESLSSNFTIKTLRNKQRYQLLPKTIGDVEYIIIEFSKGNISKLTAKQVNSSLELKLSNIIINHGISATTFTLTPPNGVDVIDETK